MATYTRLQLRSFQTSSFDFLAQANTFTLVNNNSSTAYFAMEGVRYWDGTRHVYKILFPSASLSGLVNCTVVSGSTNAGFIINPNATATFVFTPIATIAKEQMQFSAPNAQVFSLGDATASGSLFGVDLNLVGGGGGPYVFTTKAELQTAVNLWISDNTAALATYGEINTWVTTAITDMSALFISKTTFNSDISNWDVSNVTNMNSMFRSADAFDQDISSWDVENVTSMNSTFALADSFNQNIDSWKVGSVTSMQQIFSGALAFNQSLQSWSVSNVTNMESMFTGATSFNSDIGFWDVSGVTNMSFMFQGATAFNKPINDWQVQKVTNMGFMFASADSFQQPLNLWEVNALTSASDFMGATGGSSAITYTGLDTLYNGWAANEGNLLNNLTISFGDSTFTSTGAVGKAILADAAGKNWTITDGGLV